MDPTQYQRLILEHALNVMACDGDIDAREVGEIRRMTTDTPYFHELDVEQELIALLQALASDGSGVIERSLESLIECSLSERQCLKLIEVLLHVVDADGTVEKAERLYLQRVREGLRIPVETIARRFPERFALFIPGSGGKFQAAVSFQLPEALPDATQFL